MPNLLLYFASAFIWGSTWLAIQYQIGNIAPTWSVVFRFTIASALLISYCILKRCSLRFSLREHAAFALQGFLLFSVNYILYYIGSAYFISGIVAVIFASIIVMNIFNSRVFFGTPIVPRVLLGACIGLGGLAVIFWSEISGLNISRLGISYVLTGLGICLVATYFASLGNMSSTINQKRGLPILQTNAIGMAYGALFTLIIALIMQDKLSFDGSMPYIASLIYLAVFGSIFAFGCYLKLLGKIGPERAAYTFVFIPIIAMTLSTLFEHFTWTSNTFIGTALVIWGNVLVLKKNAASTTANQKPEPHQPPLSTGNSMDIPSPAIEASTSES